MRRRLRKSALTAVRDHDFTLGLSAAGSARFNLFHQIHIACNLSKDYVFPVQPRSFNRADEELGTVGVRASIGHRENSGLGVLDAEVLISKFLAIDGFATGSISTSEVTALDHKVRNDTMEFATLEAEALLSGAEGTEVLGRLRNNIGEKGELDATSGLTANGDVEENLGISHSR